MNFIKLNHQHSFNGIKRGSATVDFGNVSNNEYRGIRYHTIQNEFMYIDVFKIIPKRYRNDFVIQELVAKGTIPPHTDSVILTTINFYITTGNYTTNFFKFKNNIDFKEVSTYKLPVQTDGSIFFEHELDVVNSFDAEPNDIYLLDVKTPHSVSSNKNTDFSVYRTALALQSSVHRFDAVLEMLKETNSI